MKPRDGYLFILVLVAAIAIPLSPANADDAMRERIESQMRAPDRHEFDLPRDAARKPYEIFQFLGLKEGMTALDVGAYAGYTTEMMSAAVGPSGHVFSQNTMNVYLNFADGYHKRTLDERLVRELLEEAGIEVEAASELFRNADDSITLMVYNDDIYRRSDRILLRAVPR